MDIDSLTQEELVEKASELEEKYQKDHIRIVEKWNFNAALEVLYFAKMCYDLEKIYERLDRKEDFERIKKSENTHFNYMKMSIGEHICEHSTEK